MKIAALVQKLLRMCSDVTVLWMFRLFSSM